MKKNRILPAEQVSPVDEDTGLPIYDGPSKSQLKRESTALQALGEELAAQPTERLKRVAMPDNLREALAELQRIPSHGARKRQLQLIGKLMRSVDPAPLIAALDEIKGVSAQAKAHQQRLEKLRDRVMASDAEFATLARDYPRADIQQLRQLRRNALKEAGQNKPPRAYRELFRQLRELVEGGAATKVGAGETAPGDFAEHAPRRAPGRGSAMTSPDTLAGPPPDRLTPENAGADDHEA